MRKSLFLTLALALVSFIGANAQWSVTLTGMEGLPGNYVARDGVQVMLYQSGIITPDKPIQKLRFTCAGNNNNEKPNGNNFIMVLSELNVYTPDLKTELTYRATSNADHNTLSKSFDGQGLRALSDGKYNNYFHSMWASTGAVADYHYIELDFGKEISSFVIEWAGRPGYSTSKCPNVVGLTEGGVDFVPYTDRSFSVGEQLTKAADVYAADYLAVRGNAVETYNAYDHSNGGALTEENTGLEGVGPMYSTLGNLATKEPSPEYVTKLIPVPEEEGKYYYYFPNQKLYLTANATSNSFNEAQNGWQVTTASIANAAKVSLNELSNGDFEIYYTMLVTVEGTEVPYKVYLGADPRSGKMKTFSEAKKKALETNKWCEGFGIECAFNWSIFNAYYTAPSWTNRYALSLVYINTLDLMKKLTDDGTLEGVAADLAEYLAKINEMSDVEINKAIEEAKATLSEFLANVLMEEYMVVDELATDLAGKTSETVKPGYYPQSAYNQYIITNIKEELQRLYAIYEAGEESLYDYVMDILGYFSSKETNLKSFYDSMYALNELPSTFTTDGTALGSLSGNIYTWSTGMSLSKPVNGIRITFLETNVGNAGGGGKWNNYPMVALSGLEIIDSEGNKLALNDQLVTTNSLELSEGSIANLFDDNNTSFWHSIWGNGTMDPTGYVYLDVKFPEGVNLSSFTLKTIGRNNASLSPKTIAVNEYGKGVDPVLDRANPYNVANATLVTDPAQLKDGGLYIISGNLRVNKAENESEPRFYSGYTPYHANIKAATNDPCVYMLQKAGDGWNILSLANGQYWAKEVVYNSANSLTTFQKDAAVVKIAKSQNIADAMVIYSEVADTTLSASFSWKNEAGTDSLVIDSTGVTVNKYVYMDWDASLAARLCYSELPGVLCPEFAAKFENHEDLINDGGAGDYLHFNKTNGEGEWNIYEVSMDDPYFLYLTSLVQKADDLGLNPGLDPGCTKADEATTNAFNSAKAEAQVAIESDKRNNAKALCESLIASIEALSQAERVGFDSEATYVIMSGLEAFEKNTWETRALKAYMDNSYIRWTINPAYFANGENSEFLFNIIELDEEAQAAYRITVPEDEQGKAFVIKMANEDKYAGALENNDLKLVDVSGVAAWVIEDLGGCQFNIKASGTNNKVHANGHLSGNGYEGNLVFWEGGANSASAWTFMYMTEERMNSIFDLTVEGDEVVAVSYFTPAGIALPAPAQGINIVVTVYANGVVETKKVLVK